MKKIICYGDSNTFGYNPIDNSRFDENIRWTSILKNNLSGDYEVINEGMCDRTGFADNPKGELFSSQKHFPKLINENEKFDILILWVGTNDLQFQYDIDFNVVEEGLKKLIDLAKEKAEKIIIIPPVILDERILKGFFSFQFDEKSVSKSKEIGKIFKQIAKDYNCLWFDVNEIIKPSDFDGLHYDESAHMLIGDKITEFVKTINN